MITSPYQIKSILASQFLSICRPTFLTSLRFESSVWKTYIQHHIAPVATATSVRLLTFSILYILKNKRVPWASFLPNCPEEGSPGVCLCLYYYSYYIILCIYTFLCEPMQPKRFDRYWWMSILNSLRSRGDNSSGDESKVSHTQLIKLTNLLFVSVHTKLRFHAVSCARELRYNSYDVKPIVG